MTDIKNIKIEDFNYNLPDNCIAKYPLEQRDSSKLLVYKNHEIIDSQFRDITQFIPSGAMLVFNNTKVIRARIFMQKATGAHIEIFCLEPHSPADYEQIFGATHHCSWHCIVGNLKKWKDDSLSTDFVVNGQTICFTATKLENKGSELIIDFSWNCDVTFSEILEQVGNIPIPPYLNREAEESDTTRYQTVYSKYDGSVAAPTAGLHFTEQVLENLKANNVKLEEVTLHVGAGTFKPVKTEYIADHEMHVETIAVRKSTIEHLLASVGNIFAVGTTSVRTLETIYWFGVKLFCNPTNSDFEFELQQWEPYSLSQNISVEDSLKSLLDYMNRHDIDTIHGKTQIMIVPSYKSKLLKAIVTNFHQPQSTLLLLISSFVGDEWKRFYAHALNNHYRFLSYGDSSLLFNAK